MKKVIFFTPILGIIIFAYRGWLYKDLEYTIPNVMLLAVSNGVTVGWILGEILTKSKTI